MPHLPAHRHLEDVVQFSQGGIAPHQHAPADLRADADQVNLSWQTAAKWLSLTADGDTTGGGMAFMN